MSGRIAHDNIAVGSGESGVAARTMSGASSLSDADDDGDGEGEEDGEIADMVVDGFYHSSKQAVTRKKRRSRSKDQSFFVQVRLF